MIGNDIVDLRFAKKESNWRRPRFLQKIFTEEEQHFIHTSPDKDVAVWLLWSGKESAYKIIARLEKQRFFAPKKIKHDIYCRDRACPIPANSAAKISYEQYTFFTQSIVTNTHIHTIAQLNEKNELPIINSFYFAENNYQTQHQTTHKHLLENYAKITNLADEDLAIQKDEWKVPHLYYKNKKQSVVISISHHGNYGGYALLSV